MNAPLEHIRLSQQAKEQLIKLKRLTGIEQWNVLCRWGFCASLAEPSLPVSAKIPADSNLEMTWKVFAGHYQDTLMALLKERCRKDRLEISDDTLAMQLKLHLHRGIGYLAGNKRIRSISTMLSNVMSQLERNTST
jgi:DNA sulfur modification protein DndE